jgi:hypothetical protein
MDRTRFIGSSGQRWSSATITNIATGDECVITFKPHGLFANKNKNEVVAQVKDPTGNDVCAL